MIDWEKEKKKIVKLLFSGFSLREIGKEYGVCRQWIGQLIKRWGISPIQCPRRRSHPEQYTKEFWRKIAGKLSIRDLNISNIARKANVSISITYTILKELNLIKEFTKIPLKDKFFSYTKKKGNCLIWTGGTLHGYGRVSWPRYTKEEYVHRIAWIIQYGFIPEGQCVLHKCKNPLCVNIDHLRLK